LRGLSWVLVTPKQPRILQIYTMRLLLPILRVNLVVILAHSDRTFRSIYLFM